MNRFTVVVLAILVFSFSAAAQSSVRVGSAAPVFSGVSLDGTSYDLADLRGTVVVITFWSTKCAICHREIPKLNRVADQYGPKKVVFLALTMENEDKIAPYLQRNPFRFQILPNSFAVVLQYADRDRGGNIDMGFPSYFVVDQQGLIKHRSSGYDRTESLAAAIANLIAEQ